MVHNSNEDISTDCRHRAGCLLSHLLCLLCVNLKDICVLSLIKSFGLFFFLFQFQSALVEWSILFVQPLSLHGTVHSVLKYFLQEMYC